MSSVEAEKAVNAAKRAEKSATEIEDELDSETKSKIRSVLKYKFSDMEDLELRFPFPEELEEEKGIYSWRDRIIVTQDIAEDVMGSEFNEIGIPSIGRIRFYNYLRARYWGFAQHQVQAYLDGDSLHQQYRQRRRSQVSRAVIASAPRQILSCDLTVYKGLGREGYLTIVDHFSKFLAATPYVKKTGASIAEKFEKLLPLFGGTCKILRTDNGGEFIAPEFKDMLARHGIKHVKAQSHTPTSQGMIEQANGRLKGWLSAGHISAARRPADALAKALKFYNTTVVPSLGFTPSQLNTDDLPDRIRLDVRAKLIANASGAEPNARYHKPLTKGDKVRVDVKWLDAKVRAAIKNGSYKASHNPTFSKETYTVKVFYPAANNVAIEEFPGKRIPRGEVLLISEPTEEP